MNRLRLLLALGSALWFSCASAAQVDGVAAVVDGRVITVSEVQELASARGKLGLQGPRDFSAEALDSLIEEALLAKEAERLGVSVADAEAEKTISDIRSRNGLDEEAFKAALIGQGLDYKGYVAEIRSQILKAKVAGQVLRSRLRADDEALREYYLKHLSDFCEPDRLRLGHLELPGDRGTAEAARSRLVAGEAPETVAKALAGDKGYEDMGLLNKESLSESIRAALEGVGPGGVSPVVELGGVCHLFVVAEEKKGRAPSYDELSPEAKEKVRGRYYEEQEQELYRQWMDALKQQASIEKIR